MAAFSPLQLFFGSICVLCTFPIPILSSPVGPTALQDQFKEMTVVWSKNGCVFPDPLTYKFDVFSAGFLLEPCSDLDPKSADSTFNYELCSQFFEVSRLLCGVKPEQSNYLKPEVLGLLVDDPGWNVCGAARALYTKRRFAFITENPEVCHAQCVANNKLRPICRLLIAAVAKYEESLRSATKVETTPAPGQAASPNEDTNKDAVMSPPTVTSDSSGAPGKQEMLPPANGGTPSPLAGLQPGSSPRPQSGKGPEDPVSQEENGKTPTHTGEQRLPATEQETVETTTHTSKQGKVETSAQGGGFSGSHQGNVETAAQGGEPVASQQGKVEIPTQGGGLSASLHGNVETAQGGGLSASQNGNVETSAQGGGLSASQNGNVETAQDGGLSASLHGNVETAQGGGLSASQQGNVETSAQDGRPAASPQGNIETSVQGGGLSASHHGNVETSAQGGGLSVSQHGNVETAEGGGLSASQHGNVETSAQGGGLTASQQGNVETLAEGGRPATSQQGNVETSAQGGGLSASQQGNVETSAHGGRLSVSQQGNVETSAQGGRPATSQQGNVETSAHSGGLSASQQGNLETSAQGGGLSVSQHENVETAQDGGLAASQGSELPAPQQGKATQPTQQRGDGIPVQDATSSTSSSTTTSPGVDTQIDDEEDRGLFDTDRGVEHQPPSQDVFQPPRPVHSQPSPLIPADGVQHVHHMVDDDYGEDVPPSGHFMAYFITAVVLCVAAYVIYHNKQKILAFVLEGRRDSQRRRLSSGGNGGSTAKYTKLQPSVEEVMPSLEKSTTSKNYIY